MRSEKTASFDVILAGTCNLDYYNASLRLSLFQIVVQVRDEGNGWIVGRTGSVEGAFPASYVETLK